MFVPAPLLDTRYEILTAAAFGDRPGIGAAELPAAVDARDQWLRAVVLGGQGHYAAARAQLRRIGAVSHDPVLLSLAASTEGSLLRQSGRHAEAAVADGRALALLRALPVAGAGFRGYVTTAQPDASAPSGACDAAGFGGVPDRTDAACDALTGLAADAIGTGRIALATRLLRRAGELADGRPRALIRWHWVSAETALAAGSAVAAAPHAERALTLAERAPSIRHRVKSTLLVAASAAANGDMDAAAASAATVARDCREHGLVPLAWACAMLRDGLADPAAAADVRDCGAVIARRGGHFRHAGRL